MTLYKVKLIKHRYMDRLKNHPLSWEYILLKEESLPEFLQRVQLYNQESENFSGNPYYREVVIFDCNEINIKDNLVDIIK